MSQVHMFSGKKEYKKNPKATKESNVQLKVCKYLKDNYPNVIFMCDLASGMNLGQAIGGMNSRMRSSRGQPDLFIAAVKKTVVKLGGSEHMKIESSVYDKCGLFIEIKRDSVYKKDGTLKSQKIKDKKTGLYYDHLKEQEEILQQLRKQGYKAEFGCGFEECKKIIDEYLN